jgi:hypothetical protein
MLGTVVTLTRSPFSEKQQISKGEYKRTQQPTFTHGMGKSDIMQSSGYFAETATFYAGLFCKTFCILQSASSPKGEGSFSI